MISIFDKARVWAPFENNKAVNKNDSHFLKITVGISQFFINRATGKFENNKCLGGVEMG